MPSDRAARADSEAGALGATLAGEWLGTPMYMAPEQIRGEAPDARSEVFSLGVVAAECLAGKPPYRSTTLDELFSEIEAGVTLALPPGTPAELTAAVRRAMAPDRAARFGSMTELREALARIRSRLGRRRRLIPLAAAALLTGAAATVVTTIATRPGAAAIVPARPGEHYVDRALEEYDLFYGDKATASLRAAVRSDPDNPRAHAYLLLFGGLASDEAARVLADAARIAATGQARRKDAALLAAAIALARRGPAAARDALPDGGDRELRFWRAELAYRARQYDDAAREFTALLAEPAPAFRGRIYDHDSAVLLYLDRVDEARAIGALYAAAFPGEADALGVYATTLAAAGQLDPALARAEDAVALSESEDTLAGLAKVRAYRGELGLARELYARSLALARDARRPLRRAALALLQAALGDDAGARATVAPCLPGGAEAAIRERGPCLLVAGLVDPAARDGAIGELDRLAAAGTAVDPPYGFPGNLAELLRARRGFDGGGCLRAAPTAPPPTPAVVAEVAQRLADARDFYAEYHLPFFHAYPVCEEAALELATGHLDRAIARVDAELRARPATLVLEVLRAELVARRDPAAARAAAAAIARRYPGLDPAADLAARLRALAR